MKGIFSLMHQIVLTKVNVLLNTYTIVRNEYNQYHYMVFDVKHHIKQKLWMVDLPRY